MPLALGVLAFLLLATFARSGSASAPSAPVGPAPSDPKLAIDGRRVIIHVPTNADPRRVVVYLHGHGQSVDGVARTLAPIFDASLAPGKRAIVIFPQLADGDPGTLAVDGALRRLIDESLRAVGASYGPATHVSVLAHSGGYLPAAALLDRGGVSVAAVALLDALYGHEDAFERFATRPGVRFGNVFGPTTEGKSIALAERLRARLGTRAFLDVTGATPLSTALAHPVATIRTREPHTLVPQATIATVMQAFYGVR